MTSIKLYLGSILLNVWAYFDKANITFFLGSVSTIVVIAYHIVKLRKELKGKKQKTDVG